MAKKVSLACSACGSSGYSTMKQDDVTTRLELKKFCRRCNAHTTHRESK
ncbi:MULTISPECIES: 50S ribosomal protein L33 [Exiguobacterium]|uniref:Large ribosomal subunit protein bL33 n=1 Tax=Exiguobacterium aurantiacum TaxID=33987 RepID=A0ABY5FN74_9BACL|nr:MULTISPECIES: 50S ribosomal protein L33 [Exiguobacterium]TCI20312.1 50S ribosomal protein L33 [Exiguobacterium sp. SL-9]TCI28484.1 50S ribosomal protein L33 [Exiguobacterium sp. SL-10]UTT43032.1 50S ribosomal protein L33 [Exiguobacterium aurantiacum]